MCHEFNNDLILYRHENKYHRFRHKNDDITECNYIKNEPDYYSNIFIQKL